MSTAVATEEQLDLLQEVSSAKDLETAAAATAGPAQTRATEECPSRQSFGASTEAKGNGDEESG